MHTADVLLPLSLPGTFSYEVPDELVASVKLGVRVLVNFGKKKIYTGIVVNIEERDDAFDFKMKPIFAQLDDEPFISEPQLKLWNWMASISANSSIKVSSMTKSCLPSFRGDLY